MRKFLLFFFIFALGVCLSFDAKAQQAAGMSSTSLLDTVVVTASRFSETQRNVTSSITIIGDDLIEKSSAKDLGDVLGQQGFQVYKTQGFLSGISIRGFSSDPHGFEIGGRVLILINGRRANTGNISKISSSNIERVEIIRGPTATQYGASAMGGVINVITKTGKDQGPFSTYLQVGMGSYDYYEAIASFGGDIKGFDYYVNYDYSHRGDYTVPSGERYVGSGWGKKHSGSMDLGYTFGKHRIGVSGYYFDSNHGYPGKWMANNVRRGDRTNKSFELNYSGSTEDDRFLWSARYSVGMDDEKYTNYRTRGISHYWTDSRMGGAQLTYNTELLSVTGGIDYAYYDMQQTWAPRHNDNNNIAGFVIGKLRLLNDSLIFSLGGRYDKYDVKVLSADELGSASSNNFSPSVGMAYLPLDWFKIRVNYAEAFLMPTARQLSSDSDQYVGNPDLKPETSKTSEIGIDLSYEELNFSVTYFHTDSEDLISSAPAPDGTNRSTSVNIGSAVRDGFELSLDADLGKRLFGSGYSLRPYLNLTKMTKYWDNDARRKLGDISDLVYGTGISFATPGNDLTASLAVQYLGTQIYRVSSGTTIFGKTTVADFNITKKILDFQDKGNLTLKASVNNLTNEYYLLSADYPNPGRNFYVGLAYNY